MINLDIPVQTPVIDKGVLNAPSEEELRAALQAHVPDLKRLLEGFLTVESKIRHVRDSAYWGAPVGTPLPLTPKPLDLPDRIRQEDIVPQDMGTVSGHIGEPEPAGRSPLSAQAAANLTAHLNAARREDERREQSNGWWDWPWDERHQEGPRPDDRRPLRTPDGDFIVYHSTSPEAAERIMAERQLRPDGVGAVGIGTTPEATRVYGTMKSRDKGVTLRLVLSHTALAKQRVQHEIGGSGHDQYLFGRPHGQRSWDGLGPDVVQSVSALPQPTESKPIDHPVSGYHVSLTGDTPDEHSQWVHIGDKAAAEDRLRQTRDAWRDYVTIPRQRGRNADQAAEAIRHILLHDRDLEPRLFVVDLAVQPMNTPETTVPDFFANDLTSDRTMWLEPDEARQRGWAGDPRDLASVPMLGEVVSMSMTHEEWVQSVENRVIVAERDRHRSAGTMREIWNQIQANGYRVDPLYYLNEGERTSEPSIVAGIGDVTYQEVGQ